ncbi:unnamed protein product [Bursaphelenchus xylophilus]|uniref:(pine wood nematode) hypothetical protein n=1 Tax=Bursaphelenchus xylophilus TaxID=6326 RepID=A0A7I8XM98_BURXY|nr:unnamed protein product [Bursaphelenchus xylophilus]CAG9086656.1 unnamed protein product [Bursaphelenchus xylophilus]
MPPDHCGQDERSPYFGLQNVTMILRADTTTWLRIITVSFVLQISFSANTIEDFKNCKKESGFSLKDESLICDPRNDLKPGTLKKLTDILRHVQTKLKCECADLCARDTDLDGKFVGLLQVTNTEALNDTGRSFDEVANEIYELSGLGNKECDNGMLLFYVKDTQELASMRGHGKFILLKDQDLDRLHQIASGNKPEDLNAAAMEFLVDKDNATQPAGDIQKFLKSASDTWAPIVGLVVVGVLLLLILALLLACCFAKLCGCCASKPHKNKYYVTPVPTYKTVDPIYIVTPQSDRHDLIYSTPYSGSPLPPPPAMYMSTPPPPINSNGYSTYAGSPHSTRSPLPIHKHDTLSKGSPKKDKDRTGTSKSNYSIQNSSSTTLPMPETFMDTSYLDPTRKRETQTREEFVE